MYILSTNVKTSEKPMSPWKGYYYYYFFKCPWYSIPKGEEINANCYKKLYSIGVLRKVCGVVVGVAKRVGKNDSIETLNGD